MFNRTYESIYECDQYAGAGLVIRRELVFRN